MGIPYYPYTPLLSQEGHQFIRILQLDPPKDSFDKALKGKLVDECLCQSRDTYEALSYTWGAADPPIYWILIGQHVHAIRPNLHAALLRLRVNSYENPRRLWVDALCINQLDRDERNQQVPLMRCIFGNATRTLAWLGNDSPGQSAKIVFEWFRLSKEEMHKWPTAFQPRLMSLDDRVPPKGSKFWDAFHSVFTRSWFSRRWIIQEVAVSKPSSRLLCGDASIDLSILEMFATPLLDELNYQETIRYAQNILNLPKSYFPGIGVSCVFPGTDLRSTRPASSKRVQPPADEDLDKLDIRRGADSGAESLIRMLNQFDDLECSDPRDRVGALAGLSSSLQFSVDYNLSVQENYIAFAVAVVQHGAGAYLLRSAAHRKTASSTCSSLPSWIPDWRCALSADNDLSDASVVITKGPKLAVEGTTLMVSTQAMRLPLEEELKALTQMIQDPHPPKCGRRHSMKHASVLCLDIVMSLDKEKFQSEQQLARRHWYAKRTQISDRQGKPWYKTLVFQESSDPTTYKLLLEMPEVRNRYTKEQMQALTLKKTESHLFKSCPYIFVD